jgi:hypothetical protein
MMLGGSKVSISLVCVSISILGEINQATLDSTFSRSIELSISVPGIHSPFPEGFATLNDIVHPGRLKFFINHVGNLGKKRD